MADAANQPRFGAVLTAMVTPFTDRGDLDLDGAQKLATYLVENGNDGIVVAGTTGESPTISYEEQRDLIVAVREAIPDNSLVAGAGSNDTRTACKNTEMATAAGADGILAVAPYYNKPSQAGLLEHFRVSAGMTDLPVMVYDVPGRTSRKIETDTIVQLAEVDNIVALKDAAADPAETASLIAKVATVDPSFEVYSGDDGLTLPFLSVGAVGVVGVVTHYVGQLMADMIAAYNAGRVAEAVELNQRMLPAFGHFGYDDAPSPVPTKSMMNLLGISVGSCRLPMGPAPDDMESRSKAVLAALGPGRRLMAAPVRVSFLGGLGEIGRNCAAVEVDGRIMLIDCGLMFPDSDTAGVDLVLPDFTYLRENAHRVEGVVATHGHEDHIGALSYLLDEMPLKIIGSPLTIGMAKNRITERGVLDQASFIEVSDNDRITVGPFDLEFFPVTHSVPHGFATAFHTPQGVILHSGDFKLDMTPVDSRLTDLAGLGHLAKDDGVRLLLCDSTNAEEAGFSDSETSIGQSIHDLFRAREGRRIIIACFASHIHRIQQIADAAIAGGRTIATLGRSMNNNVALARQMGLLTIPDAKLRDIEDVDDLADGELCVISTGSQGEPLSALARMASGDSKWLSIREGDCVILSSHPIPGNEMGVTRVIDGLVRRGAEVVHSATARVHATGHAKAEELRVMHSIVQPEWFIPVHGEYRHLAEHARIATQMGLAADKVMICADGDSVMLTDDGLRRTEDIPAEYVYIAGSVGALDENVLFERRILGQDGFVSVIVPLSIVGANAELLRAPEVISRGWVDGPEGDELRKEATHAVREAIEEALAAGKRSRQDFERAARRALGRFINKRTRLRPMVVPVVLGAHEGDESGD